jgi:trans-aconitate methyltransferase
MDLLEARALAHRHAGSRHPWERARLDVVVKLLESHRLVGPGSVVLDVGCGDTFVADALARHWPGARVAAVDPAFDEDTLRHYRELGACSGVSVHTHWGDIPEAMRRNAALVLLMDVIEHVADDVALVRGLLDDGVVGPATQVLLTVPAYQTLFSSHDVHLKHHRRYSRRSLRAALSRAGLRVNECGAFFVSLLPLRVAQRQE